MRDAAAEPGHQPEDLQEQHGDADGDARAPHKGGAQMAGDHECGHGLERLHGHGHPVTEGGEDLQGAKGCEHGAGLKAGREDHASEKREAGAEIAEGAGQLVAVEAEPWWWAARRGHRQTGKSALDHWAIHLPRT